MKLIVGLGNPGEEYAKTRHNMGFLFLEYLEERYGFKINDKIKNTDSVVGQIYLNNEKVVFAKPLTYMNLSGNAVQRLKKWYDVEDKDIIVIFDDIDIPFGECRYKTTGSGGTHNGMKNIVQMLSTKDIARIKIGIGGLKHEKQDLADFVLQRFTTSQLKELETIFDEAFEKLQEFLDN
ncbi:MAG: aminoacyl-tRNA hydrolase [Clostridia bacterium]|nr:aminoacyl-tRNA hydrolase [Clostridia bacterium]